MINALEYFEMWIENDIGIYDDLAKHRRIAYECIKECLKHINSNTTLSQKKKRKPKKFKNNIHQS